MIAGSVPSAKSLEKEQVESGKAEKGDTSIKGDIKEKDPSKRDPHHLGIDVHGKLVSLVPRQERDFVGRDVKKRYRKYRKSPSLAK